jgi:uncharacterized membrane protein
MNAQLARRLTLVSYAGLIITIVLWYFIIDPPRFVFSTILSLLYLGILLLPAYALIRKKPRTYLWSSYLILIIFMHAVVETYANHDHRGYAIAELVLSLVFFISTSLCVRYERQGLL